MKTSGKLASLTLLVIPLMLLTGCNKRQTMQLTDVTKATTLTLSPAPGQGTSVHSFSMRIRGKIDGSADIWGTDLQSNRFHGSFACSRSGDYYDTNCVINYRPIGVHTGHITIEYEFGCIH